MSARLVLELLMQTEMLGGLHFNFPAGGVQGAKAPRFWAEDGSPIFPPEDDKFELWWLTDAKRKEKGDEQSAGDVGLKSIASCLHLQELNLSELAMCMG